MSETQVSRKHLVVSSAILITSRVLAAVLAFGSSALLGAHFGVGYEADAFFVARLIPVTLCLPLSTAFHMTLTPLYARTRAEGAPEAAEQLAADVLRLTLWGSAAAALLYAVFAEPIIAGLAPGFSAEGRSLAVGLTRILSICIVFLNLHATFDSLLNAVHHYLLPAVSLLWIPLGTICGILIAGPRSRMTSVTVGVLAGATLQLVTILPATRRVWRPGLPRAAPGAAHFHVVIGRFGYSLLIAGTSQVNAVIDRFFGSLLGEGAVAALSFGSVVIAALPGLVVLPVTKVLFPELQRMILADDRERIKRLITFNFLLVSLTTFPLVGGLLAFATPVTKLFFGYGAFGPEAIAETSRVIFYLALSLFPISAGILLTYYCFLSDCRRLLVTISVASIVLNCFLDWWLMRWLGLAGIALSSTLLTGGRLVVLLVALRRLLGPLGLAALVGPLVKMAIASAGSLAAVELLGHWFAPQLHWSGKAGHFALAGLAMAVGLSAYLLLNVALRNTVLIEIWRNEKQARSAAAAPELEAEFATP